MELVGVSHGLTLEEFSRWEALARSIGARHWQVCDTGSPTKDAKRVEVTEVSNSHYEFGGYFSGIQRVQTDGPYLIVNSTVFLTRALGIWKRVKCFKRLQPHLRRRTPVPTRDPEIRIPTIPAGFSSSRPKRFNVTTALERTTTLPRASPAYAAIGALAEPGQPILRLARPQNPASPPAQEVDDRLGAPPQR